MLHNKFEIVVRDAKTGEIKQKAYAKNRILDGWTLKNHGNLSAIYFRDTEQGEWYYCRIYPQGIDKSNIYIKRASRRWEGDTFIATYESEPLPAESNIGWKIDKVGLAYVPLSVDDSTFFSEASLKDSEGNPIIIRKSETDIIVFYATVYYEMPGLKYKPILGDRFDLFERLEWGEKVSDERTDRHAKGTRILGADKYNGLQLRYLIQMQDDKVQHFLKFDDKYYISKEKVKVSGEYGNLKWDAFTNLKLYRNGDLMDSSEHEILTRVGKGREMNCLVSSYETDGVFRNDYFRIEERNIKNSRKKCPVQAYEDLMLMSIRNTNKKAPYSINSYVFFDHFVVENLTYMIQHYPEPIDFDFLDAHGAMVFHNKARVSALVDGVWEVLGECRYNSTIKKGRKNVSALKYELLEPYTKNENYGELLRLSPIQSKENMIKFNTPIAPEDVIEADYEVDYLPKDSDHVVFIDFDITMEPGSND